MPALLMDSLPATRALPATSPRPTLFAACLQRCRAAGLRLIVNAPADTLTFSRSLQRFTDRRIDPPAHAHWETAYRVFNNRSRQPHDRGSWLLLVADEDDRVVGAVTARLFCSEIVADYLHTTALLEHTGPVFREHCELALGEMFSATAKAGRIPGEISHWSVRPGPQARVVMATLARALATLSVAFDSPVVIAAADHRRGEVARLMRFGAAPLGRAKKFSLPPFVYHATASWLRLLLIDAPSFVTRAGGRPKEDLALLRLQCPIYSLG